MPSSIADLRREYARATLDERQVAPEPFAMFSAWFAEALAAEVPEPNAMTLATATAEGLPSARVVLLKGIDPRGFVFFTDYRSRKAKELAANPNAALCFFWQELERQVRVVGRVERISAGETDAYFQSRPVGSRLGAWASEQSRALVSRAELEERLREVEVRYPDGRVPTPPHWGGYRLSPVEVEFWQGRASRLHDRVRYLMHGTEWRIERLSP